MARRPKQHQRMPTSHKPVVQKVRTDILIHCRTEPSLQKLLHSLEITDDEFLQIFKTPEKQKKGLFKKSEAPSNTLKQLVGAYLVLLLTHAKIKEFLIELQEKDEQQRGLLDVMAEHPEYAAANMSFNDTLHPDEAVRLLDSLKTTVTNLEKDIEKLTQNNLNEIDRYTALYENVSSDVNKMLSDLQIPIAKKDVSNVLKILGGIV